MYRASFNIVKRKKNYVVFQFVGCVRERIYMVLDQHLLEEP